jgi:hydrogenase 3 maturation protease
VFGLLGIGNVRLGDDGLGPVFARAFRAEGWVCWNGGIAPENFVSVIRRAGVSRVVLLDAAEMGLEPGAVRVLEAGELVSAGGFGTHAPSPEGLAGYLATFVPEVRVVGVQPLSCRKGERLSEPVRAALRRLGGMLRSGEWPETRRGKNG